MGKVNVCLKRSYVIVTSLIAIFSALLLAITLFSHGYFHEDEELESMLTGIHTMYAVSIISLLLSIIGVYGAYKEKQWVLIVFAVGMILCSLFLTACEIQGVAVRPQVFKEVERHYQDMLPLANASESFLENLNEVQMEWQCCGLDQGYKDWGYNISKSCLCTEESTNPCVAAPQNSALIEHMTHDHPILIYKEPCLPFLIMHEIMIINTVLGIMLGITLLWVLSAVLCIVILCQLNRKKDVPTVVYSPEAKAGNYTSFTDAAEYT